MRAHGVLFVVDCVICGFGRLGTWFGIERWPDVRPDLITLAKGVTRRLPAARRACSSRRHVAAPFFAARPAAPVLRHGATYAGHPTCCAAALATLDIYEREGLIARGRALEGPLARRAARRSRRTRRGRGARRARAARRGRAERGGTRRAIPARCRASRSPAASAGLLVRALGTGVAVSPPLTIAEQQIEEIGAGIAAGLAALEPAPLGG